MRRTRQVARMAMGGAVCGGLLGIPLGAALGVIVGWWCGNVSWGLDGAVLGILLLGAVGALVGAFLGVTADDRTLSLTDDIAVRLPADDKSPLSRR